MSWIRKSVIVVGAVLALCAAGAVGVALAGAAGDAGAARGADVITEAVAPNAQAVLFGDGTEKIRFKNIQGDIDNPAVGVLCINVKDTIKVGKGSAEREQRVG